MDHPPTHLPTRTAADPDSLLSMAALRVYVIACTDSAIPRPRVPHLVKVVSSREAAELIARELGHMSATMVEPGGVFVSHLTVSDPRCENAADASLLVANYFAARRGPQAEAVVTPVESASELAGRVRAMEAMYRGVPWDGARPVPGSPQLRGADPSAAA